jgi:hypothetical protein
MEMNTEAQYMEMNTIGTFDIVASSGSSCGSAQSTIMSHPQTLIRPVPSRRLARDAAL